MVRELDQDELIDCWTLVGDEVKLVATKRGAAKLGFALLLRFYTERGRFPRGRSEIPDNAVDYVARQVGVERTEMAFYDLAGRTSKAHRAQIRAALGFRECTVADADAVTEWLVAGVTQVERTVERVREQALARCRVQRIEPPTAGRLDRMVRSALHRGEELLFIRVAARLDEAVKARLLELITEVDDPDEDGPPMLAAIRAEAGNVSLNTMLAEIAKLEAVRVVGLPADVFTDVAPKIVAGWCGRAMVEAPSHLRSHPTPATLTLLAALVSCRTQQITDTLVELLCSTVHRIGARAEVRVTNQLIKEFKRVTGKENLLFRVAEATAEAGDRLVREAVYPVVSQATLRDLVAEFKSSGPTYQRAVKTTLRGSYTNHYRAGLIKLLAVLQFRSNNTAHRPVLDAVELIGRHCHVGGAGGRIRWVSNVSTVSYKGHRFPMEIIDHCVWLYFRFPLSFREVEEMMLARGVAVSHETIRRWCAKFGQAYANELRRRRPRPGTKWHLDEVFIKIRGVQRYLWRAVDQNGVVLDVLVTSRRNAAAARRFLRKLLKGLCYVPKRLITDKLASYPVAHRELMGSVKHRRSRYLNNRAENSHQPTRQRERAMKRFTSIRHAQRFLSAHGPISGHFRPRRHRLSATEWRTQMTDRFAQWHDVATLDTAA